MCVLLPKVLIFISLGRGVPVDIKRATTNLNILQETMVLDLQTAEGIHQNLFRGPFTNFHPFGTDPFENNGVQCRNRDNGFYSSFQICDIFSELTNNRNTVSKGTIVLYKRNKEIGCLTLMRNIFGESAFLVPGIIEFKT